MVFAKRKFAILVGTLSWLTMHALDINGVVTDAHQQPLSFASVYLQNHPQTGTITDEEGRFSLSTEHTADKLIVTFIGYEHFELPIAQIENCNALKISLKEQPIVLDAVVASAKGSKRQQRKQTKELLAKIRQRLQNDFPDEVRNYRIVSDVSIYNEGKTVAFDELVGHIVELPHLQNHNKRDSLQIKTDFTRYYIAESIENGLRNFDQSLLKRKEKKQLQKIDFENSEPIHRMLWQLNIRKLFDDIGDETANWTIVERDSQSQLLAYTKTFKLPSILTATMRVYLTIDAAYSVQRFSQSITVAANIPFGYKLSDAQLAALNLLLIGNDTDNLDKYRLKTVDATAERNAIFVPQDGKMVVSEKSWKADVHATDKNGQAFHFDQKATVHVLQTNTTTAKPYNARELTTKAPRTQIGISQIK